MSGSAHQDYAVLPQGANPEQEYRGGGAVEATPIMITGIRVGDIAFIIVPAPMKE